MVNAVKNKSWKSVLRNVYETIRCHSGFGFRSKGKDALLKIKLKNYNGLIEKWYDITWQIIIFLERIQWNIIFTVQ